MTLWVPALIGALDADAAETRIGKLAPSVPATVVLIWPAGPGTAIRANRIALGAWRAREVRAGGMWRSRAIRPAAPGFTRQLRPKATWT